MNIRPISKDILLSKIDQFKTHSSDKNDYKVPKFSFKGSETWAWCSKVYDGDTIHACFLINDQLLRFSVRLAGIDTPELRTKDLVEKKAAICAKDFVADKILYKPIYLRLKKFDKYGRLLAVIYHDNSVINYDSIIGSLNQEIIDNGHAVPYDGGTKKK